MLRNRNFMLLLVATCISAAGDTFTFIAIAVQVDTVFADAAGVTRTMGAVMIAMALPQLVLGIFAGTLVDRWDRRWVMIASDLIRAALIPVFFLFDSSADLPLALLVSFSVASFGVFFYPARTALLPSIVKEEDLLAANGWMQVGNTSARLAGPILAGIVLSRWGSEVAFTVDAISYAVSAVLVIGIAGVVTRVKRQTQEKDSAWKDLVEGARYAGRSRLLQGITLGLSVAMLGMGAVNVLFVPFLRYVFDAPPEGLGGIMTAEGVGMFVGGLLVGALGRRLSPTLISVAALIGLGFGVGLFGMAPTYAVAVIVVMVVGLTIPPINAALQTLIQRGVPQKLLGRASAVMDMAIALASLVSMGTAAWLGSVLGLRETFVFGGIMIFLGAVAMWALIRGQVDDDAKDSSAMARSEAMAGELSSEVD